MAQPNPYNRAYNFADYQASNPTTPLPGNQVDTELNLIKVVIDQIRTSIAALQRDDYALKNQSVGYDQLKAELDGFGFNPPTEWATATNYVERDTVFHDNGFYRCSESHVSGVFATDLAADKWALIADFTAATTDAEAAQAAAELAQAAAEAAASSAELAKANAESAAGNAATSETNAANSAISAAASADTAATLIGGTVTAAVRHDVAQGLDNTQKAQARANIGISALGGQLLDDTTTGQMQTTLGVSAFAQTLLDDSDTAAARSTLGLDLVGMVFDFAGATAPTGFLFCYGQNVSRTTYAALFAKIGTIYGAGDGSTTFAIPDLRGRVVAGQDDMGGTSANRLTLPVAGGVNGDTLGDAGGVETVTLTAAEIPAHTHSIATSAATGVGTSTIRSGDASGGGGVFASGSVGSGGAHNNLQPTLILNKIIFTGA